ncbi:MAG: hypothetical protein DRJ45_05955 [Thermoprotei archaeon]|nr:MAG: hypothetical protein DRJ45_05955 [Thermoprotei archaeon]
MNIQKLFIGLVFASLCSAQINISGTVVDENESPVVLTVVSLSNHRIDDTTDQNGNFLLSDGVTKAEKVNNSPRAFSVKISKSSLHLNANINSNVDITTYNLKGAIVFNIKKTIHIGHNSITIHNCSGISFYQIKMNGSSILIKHNSIGKSFSHFNTHNLNTVASIPFSIQAKKGGYYDYSIPIKNLDTNGVKIKLIRNPDIAADADGNVYQTFVVAGQCWTSNLRTTRYSDGTRIPNIEDKNEWKTMASPAYGCNKKVSGVDSLEKFGLLYNWYVVDPDNQKKIAPEGWRVPTIEDFIIMADFLVKHGLTWDGSTETYKLGKALASKEDWLEPDFTLNPNPDSLGTIGKDLSRNNKAGFTAPPSSYRCGYTGTDNKLGHTFYMWCIDVNNDDLSYCGALLYDDDMFYHQASAHKRFGHSIRLIKE